MRAVHCWHCRRDIDSGFLVERALELMNDAVGEPYIPADSINRRAIKFEIAAENLLHVATRACARCCGSFVGQLAGLLALRRAA